MTAPKAPLPMGVCAHTTSKNEKLELARYSPISSMFLVAGERIKIGDLVRVGRNGKAYRYKIPKGSN